MTCCLIEDASSCIHAGPCFVHAAFVLSLTEIDNGKRNNMAAYSQALYDSQALEQPSF